MDVRMPNGTIIKNVPEGLKKDELLRRLKTAGYDTDLLLEGPKATPENVVAPKAPEETGRSWYELSGKGLTKGLGTQIAEGARQGLGGVSQAAVDALPDSIDQLPPGLSYEEIDRLGGVRQYYAQVYGITSNEQLKQIKAQATQNITERRRASEKKVQEATPEDLTLLEAGLRGGAESVARNLPGIVASLATGNPVPALASAGLQTGAESYGEARAEGLSPAKAARYAGIDASIEIATELLPTKFLIDAVGASSLNGVKKELLKFAVGEMSGEQLATFGQSVNAYANDLDQELAQAQTLAEKLEIQGRRQALTAIATLASAGTFAGGVGAATKIMDISRGRAERAGEIPEEEFAPEVTPVEEVAPEPAIPTGVAPTLRGLEGVEVPPETIEGVPPAVVDSAKDLLALADEGKPIVLFRAKSLARQLGVDLPQNANKETTLTALRDALALVAAPPAAVPEVVPPVAETARPELVNPFLTAEQQAGVRFPRPRDFVLTPEGEAPVAPTETSKLGTFDFIDVSADPRIQAVREEENAVKDQLRVAYDERLAALDTNDETALNSAFDKIDALNAQLSEVQQRGAAVNQQVRAEQAGVTKIEPVAPTVAPEVTAPALPEIEVPEVAKLASQIADIVAPPRVTLPEAPAPRPIITPEETVRVYHSGSRGEGETGRWVSTNKEYAKNYRPDLPLFYTDIPANDPRVRNPDYPEQGVREGFTFNFELTPEEATQLKPIEAPRMEVPSELPRTGIEQAVVGTTPRGIEMPLPRPVAAGPRVERAELPRLAAVEPVVERAAERAEVVPPALETPKAPLSRVEAQNIVNTLQKGDVIVTEEGDRISVDDVARNKSGDIIAVITPKVGAEGFATLDFDGLVSLLTPQSYTDINTGERRLSRPATIEKAAPSTEPTRVFESIETLNRETPDLSEQARDQAPSLRRELGKAKRDYDAGKITGDVFAETAGNLLLKTQKERVVRPRVRGAEYIRERLLNAKRNGVLSDQAADLAEWFVRQNPLLVDDLGISIRQQPEAMKGTAGFYNPVSRIATIFNNAGDTQTPVHEILHHLEQLMPAHIRANILKAYTKQLTKASNKARTDDEKAFFRAIENFQYFSGSDSYSARVNAKNEYNKALSLIKDGKVPKSHYQYASPSEFWAINGSRIVEGRYGIPPGIVGQIKRWLREFIEKVKDAFGLTSDAPIIRALDSLAKADGKYQTRAMLATAPSYAAVEPPPKDLAEVRKRAMEKAKGPSIFQRAMNQFEGHGFYKNLVKKLADVTDPIMEMDRTKERAELLITLGPDRNNIASELVRSPNITDFIITREIEPVERELQSAIKDYANAAGVSVEDAVNKLDGILIAIHEEKRRETNYLRNVGLRNDIRLPARSLPFAEDQPAMTPADYREYLEGLRSKLPPDQAAGIQDVMRVIVDKFKTPRGFSPKAVLGKPTPTDINDKFYDLIPRKINGQDAYTPEFLKTELGIYRKLKGDQKTAINKVRKSLAKIQELERELSREANYWTPQVDSVVASYQWGDTYVPFQGIPGSDDGLDYSSKKLSGELTETAQAWDGRSTDFDSPILQSIHNAKRAAHRAARKDLVNVTLVNNIKQGFMRAKSKDPEVYTFDDRRAPDFDFSVLQGANKVLAYQPNGDVHVYELKEQDKIDALKSAYRKLNPGLQEALDAVGKVTSWFAQYHTRFNIAFAPMDFLTNTMTNLGFITAGKGGVREGARYIAQTLSNVARNGLVVKTGNLSRALSSKDPRALQKLIDSDDPFYREAIDYLRLGGKALQRQALGIGIERDKLVKAVGPSMIVKTREQVARLFDIYGDAFELTSRLAAYTTHLKDITARAKLEGVDVDDPEVQEALKREAATFALELMNFRKMGEYGRILSSLYMFFKPGATSAKLAYDAVRKGFIKAESALENSDPAVWARLTSKYELEELEAEQAKPRPDEQKITELENAIRENEAAKQKFIDNYNLERKNAVIAIPLFMATGAIYYSIAQMFASDDDEGRNRIATDEMSRWTRYARMPVPGSEDFFQLPWGYGIGAFGAAGAQIAALKAGNLSVSDFAGNMIEIGLDSFMPFPASRTNPFDNFAAWVLGTISPSAARGFIEYAMNTDSLGNPIYNSRLGKYADAYSGTARPGELHNVMSDVVFGMTKGEIDINPNTIAYALNTYADGPNVLAEGAFGLALVLKGEKDIDLKKDVPIFKRFVGRMSNFDAREFKDAEKWIQKEARKYKTFRDIRSPEEYDEYVDSHPSVPIISNMYDKVLNGTLSNLSEQRKLIMRNRDLTMQERKELLDDIDYNIDAVKRNFVESYKVLREEEEAGS